MWEENGCRSEESEGLRPVVRIRRTLENKIEMDLSHEVLGCGVDICGSR